MATSLSVLKKKSKKEYFCQKKEWTYRPKTWHAHKTFDFRNNMGRVSLSHTSPSACQARNSSYICMHVYVYPLDYQSTISNIAHSSG